MKNVADVLRGKEQELEHVNRQVEALRLVASLLAEQPETSTKMPVQSVREANWKEGTTDSE